MESDETATSVDEDGGLADRAADLGDKMLDPLRSTVFNDCPGGLCALIQDYNEVVLAAAVAIGVFFFLTLVPPVFSWSRCKPDGKKRVVFAFLACVAFYFWLVFLVLNSVYCFGFLAHEGPCVAVNRTAVRIAAAAPPYSNTNAAPPYSNTNATVVISDTEADDQDPASNILNGSSSSFRQRRSHHPYEDPLVMALNSPPASVVSLDSNASSCANVSVSAHHTDLRNLTCTHIIIVLVLFVILVANAKEALNAKALNYNETLCKREEVRKFLSQLVAKPPEVGHYVTCFHPAKAPDIKTNTSRKVVTFSAIENFDFNTWRDFSDTRLIEPSTTYPIIEIEIVLNFFPGDHFTAEKYKAFVVHITKQHQGKDSKINIDDYFHIEDQREWTFFIGNPEFIAPWWSKGFPRFLLSCVFLLGWPARMGYNGQIAKHQVEVKKAVFCENTSQDEGVSLSATPGSGSNETTTGQAPAVSTNAVKAAEANGKAEEVKKEEEEVEDEADSVKVTAATTDGEEASPAKMATKATSPPPALPEDPLRQNPHPPGAANPRQSQAAVQAQQGLNLELQGRRQNEHLVNAVISNPPPIATQMIQQQHYSQHQRQQQHNPHRQQQHYHQQQQQQLYQQQQQLFQQPLQQQQLYSAGVLQAASRQAPPPLQPPQRPSRSHHQQQQQQQHSSSTADSKDVVTAVTHHQDVNGVNAVNTIALKDIDVQMSALSGYETYV